MLTLQLADINVLDHRPDRAQQRHRVPRQRGWILSLSLPCGACAGRAELGVPPHRRRVSPRQPHPMVFQEGAGTRYTPLAVCALVMSFTALTWHLRQPGKDKDVDYRPVAKPSALRSGSTDEGRKRESLDSGETAIARAWRMLFGSRGTREEDDVAKGEGPRESLLCTEEQQQQEGEAMQRERKTEERAQSCGAGVGMGLLDETRED
eukprot:627131-Rhodomonas_salina.1